VFVDKPIEVTATTAEGSGVPAVSEILPVIDPLSCPRDWPASITRENAHAVANLGHAIFVAISYPHPKEARAFANGYAVILIMFRGKCGCLMQF
jgi:hypothetical protein